MTWISQVCLDGWQESSPPGHDLSVERKRDGLIVVSKALVPSPLLHSSTAMIHPPSGGFAIGEELLHHDVRSEFLAKLPANLHSNFYFSLIYEVRFPA